MGIFLTMLISALIVAGCTAKQKTESSQTATNCEKRKTAMNGAATKVFGPSSKKNTIVNDGR